MFTSGSSSSSRPKSFSRLLFGQFRRRPILLGAVTETLRRHPVVMYNPPLRPLFTFNVSLGKDHEKVPIQVQVDVTPGLVGLGTVTGTQGIRSS